AQCGQQSRKDRLNHPIPAAFPRLTSLTDFSRIIFGDLIGKLDVLRVECPKCGRSGRYARPRLARWVDMQRHLERRGAILAERKTRPLGSIGVSGKQTPNIAARR